MSSRNRQNLPSGPWIVLLLGVVGILIYGRFQLYYLMAAIYQFVMLFI